ncbi:hypothetical protein DFS34DRAFT_635919 [Phlyctochytrium arcticum]|nr:hypothetical protein DFS34DRAFT_635919 [Phlyctochytrium arcticum]
MKRPLENNAHDVLTPSVHGVEDNQDVTPPEEAALENWRVRYRVVSLVPNGFPFAKVDECTALMLNTYKTLTEREGQQAIAAWNKGNSVGAWCELFSNENGACLSSSEEESFDEYRPATSATHSKEQHNREHVLAALKRLSPQIVCDQGAASVVDLSARCYRMFCTGFLKNVLADDLALELEYRSSFWDRLFENLFSLSWVYWTTGEVENNLMSRSKAAQNDADAAAAMKHDGIGTLLLHGSRVDVVFFECAGPLGKQDKTKIREDTIKVYKAMRVSLDSQRQVIEAMRYDEATCSKALSRISAFGIVVAQRTARIYAAKWVSGHALVNEVAVLPVPSRFEDWGSLGNLLKELFLIRERLGFLYNALKQMYRTQPAIPGASFQLTPTKRRKYKVRTS